MLGGAGHDLIAGKLNVNTVEQPEARVRACPKHAITTPRHHAIFVPRHTNLPMGNIRAASALRNNYRWKYIDCIRSRAFYWFKIYYFIAVEEKSQTIAYYKVQLNYSIQHIEIKGETFVKYTHDIQS